MISVYLAAHYSRRIELQGYSNALQERGIEVTSRWLVYDPPLDTSLLTDDEWRERAEMDRDDVLRADALVLFTEESERGNGGRHVEFGLALATGKSIIVVGPKEHLFHRLPEVRVVASREEALDLLLSLAS